MLLAVVEGLLLRRLGQLLSCQFDDEACVVQSDQARLYVNGSLNTTLLTGVLSVTLGVMFVLHDGGAWC